MHFLNRPSSSTQMCTRRTARSQALFTGRHAASHQMTVWARQMLDALLLASTHADAPQPTPMQAARPCAGVVPAAAPAGHCRCWRPNGDSPVCRLPMPEPGEMTGCRHRSRYSLLVLYQVAGLLNSCLTWAIGHCLQGSFSANGTFASYVPATREMQECDLPDDT